MELGQADSHSSAKINYQDLFWFKIRGRPGTRPLILDEVTESIACTASI
jgi:hypothetical protein